MLTTTQFYSVFRRAGFLVPATYQPQGGGPALVEYVRFGEPEQPVANDAVLVREIAVRYPLGVFAGLGDVRGDTLQINAITYRVMGRPELIGDGTEVQVRLQRAADVVNA
jgi:hypothetical protein